MARFVDTFLRVGHRLFTHDSWHRVAYQPVLYFFLWGAAVRVAVTDARPIPFELVTPWTETAWLVLSLTCPPLALLSWYLITRSKLPRATLAGLWVRLSADFGQFVALLTYHLITLRVAVMRSAEVQVYFRYLTGATVVFALLLVLRDVWALVLTERVAEQLHRERLRGE